MTRRLAVALCTIILSSTSALAQSSNYPNRPIEMVIAFPAGAVTDTLGRTLAEGISTELGQPVVVHNRPGASGAIGTVAAARAKPDGYSLMFAPAVVLSVVPVMQKNAGYDAKSFDYLCQTYKNDMAIVVRKDSPLKSVADLAKAAKEKPGQLTYGHLGIGGIPYLAMVEFATVANLKFNPIAYKGDAEVLPQVLGGQVDFGSVTMSSAARSDLNVLAIFAEARNPAKPDVPTMKELGYDVAPFSIGGLFAPAGLPADLKKRLSDACRTAAAGANYTAMAKRMYQPVQYYTDGETFARNVQHDVEQKAKILKSLDKQ
jgi:tripartite-type tricarboxylate transporter receptor subunit TctC